MSKKQDMLDAVGGAVNNYVNQVIKEEAAKTEQINAVRRLYEALLRDYDMLDKQLKATQVKLRATEQHLVDERRGRFDYGGKLNSVEAQLSAATMQSKEKNEVNESLKRSISAVVADLQRVESERDILKEEQKFLVSENILLGRANTSNARDVLSLRKEYSILKIERDTLAFDLDEAQRSIRCLRAVPTQPTNRTLQSDKGEASGS